MYINLFSFQSPRSYAGNFSGKNTLHLINLDLYKLRLVLDHSFVVGRAADWAGRNKSNLLTILITALTWELLLNIVGANLRRRCCKAGKQS